MNYKFVSDIQFPKATGTIINMMPVIMGDVKSLPNYLRQYQPLIEKCNFEHGSTVYLTIHESLVEAGKSQRRGGIHTEAFANSCWGGGGNWGGINNWGGGSWGGRSGMYMASTDGACKVWDCQEFKVDNHGGLKSELNCKSETMKENGLYWLTDRTPHEALPSQKTGTRQFFRLVSEEVDVWWAQHNTMNPTGVIPKCKVSYRNKFE